MLSCNNKVDAKETECSQEHTHHFVFHYQLVSSVWGDASESEQKETILDFINWNKIKVVTQRWKESRKIILGISQIVHTSWPG